MRSGRGSCAHAHFLACFSYYPWLCACSCLLWLGWSSPCAAFTRTCRNTTVNSALRLTDSGCPAHNQCTHYAHYPQIFVPPRKPGIPTISKRPRVNPVVHDTHKYIYLNITATNTSYFPWIALHSHFFRKNAHAWFLFSKYHCRDDIVLPIDYGFYFVWLNPHTPVYLTPFQWTSHLNLLLLNPMYIANRCVRPRVFYDAPVIKLFP